MLFTLHSLQLQRHSGGLGRGNGWRGMQPCIGSEGSEGLPPPSLLLLCMIRLLQSLTCQLKCWRESSQVFKVVVATKANTKK